MAVSDITWIPSETTGGLGPSVEQMEASNKQADEQGIPRLNYEAASQYPVGSFPYYQALNADRNEYIKEQQTPTPPAQVAQTTLEEMQGVYGDKLGRSGEEVNVMNWVNAVNSGQMTFEEAVAGIANSAEGQAYAASQAAGADGTVTGGTNNDTVTGDASSSTSAGSGATTTPTTDFNPMIQRYYQELFNRQAQQPGLDYFSSLAPQEQTGSTTMPLSQAVLYLTLHRRCSAEDLQGEDSTQRQASLRAALVSTEASLM